jgi:hypothetical protein
LQKTQSDRDCAQKDNCSGTTVFYFKPQSRQ